MRTDFGELVIEQVIVHSVPTRPRNDPRDYTVELSDEASSLTDKVQSALERRLIKILNSHACSVTEDPEPKSPLPDWIRDFMADEQDLLEVSGHLARHLQDCQTGVNSRGLLVVASARLARQRALLLVKLEQETGMQARRIGEEGKRTFDVQFFADLLFTEKANVFKLALFTADGAETDLLQGWAADRQRSNRRMAGFFLHNYLGCTFTEDPAEMTGRFHEVALKWVNTRLSEPTDAHTRVEYTMAVLAELKSAPENLNPRDFAGRHLKGDHRYEFLTHLAENGIPDRTFAKDTTLIDARLQKMQVNFASGAFLVAPLDTVDETVTFEALEGGGTKATVIGEVTAARGFSPPGGRPKKTAPAAQSAETDRLDDSRDTDDQ
ncbi:nucleoid-associated protein [Streptomyces sp. SP18CS02]|uniref:nucleoid-associated protein n=1 Tax=Streptomyces sp. SP18CS02 TaxID=3002531 RepID=UPI002E7A3B1E|nr:nucleoid-associated protein [Streptomyces sp. SP18CS02]MEE1751169.1 nucleoid-associated protein [Streptomyces sp. SP18CS02]